MIEFIERSCPLCGLSNSEHILVEQNIDQNEESIQYTFSARKIPESAHCRMVVCQNCDLSYANPAPELGWIRDNYVEAPFIASEESRHAARNHARLLHNILPNLPDRDRALDIGTSDGVFLLDLKDAGFSEVVGVEPSRESARQAPDSIKHLIDVSFFDGNNYDPGTYSLVTCFQVLEHVDDAAELTHAAFRLLKPGGVFLTVSHNFRSFTARVLGHRSPIFDLAHLQLFSRSSLKELYRQAGFSNFKVQSMSNNYPISYWIKLSPINLNLKKGIGATMEYLGIDKLGIRISAGNLWAQGTHPK